MASKAYPESASAAMAELEKYNRAQGGRKGTAKFQRAVRRDRTAITMQNGDTFIIPSWEEIQENSIQLPITGSRNTSDVIPVFCENCLKGKNLNPNALGRGVLAYDEETKEIVKEGNKPAPEINWNHNSEFAKIWESAGSQQQALKAVAGFKVKLQIDSVYTYNRFQDTYGFASVITDVEILERPVAEEAPAEEAPAATRRHA